MASNRDLDLAEVRRVAHLARLAVTDAEVATLAADLSTILDYVEKLSELDTADVPATAHAVPLPTKLREDRAGDGLSLERGLGGAPERRGDGFGVPKIIDS